MSKAENNYILITWGWDDMGDYKPTFETSFDFVTDKALDDINKLMRAYAIKRWIRDPQRVTSANYKLGDAALVEFRNVSVQPIKIVESWSYKPEKRNDV